LSNCIQSRLSVGENFLSQFGTEKQSLQQQQHKIIENISSQVEVCAAADETFFDQVILVMLDLPSGYIFVEDKSQTFTLPTVPL
jgi:hypothetical protein